jgi:hypothetical protein
MSDLREMTALELLACEARRELRRRSLGARALLAYECAGISDLDVIYRKRAGDDALGGIFELTDGDKRVEPPLVERDLLILPLVGAPIYAQDRDNVDEWAAVARRWDGARKDFESHWVSTIKPRKVTTRFLAASHGPSYARKVVESAIQHKISPFAYGFDLAPAEWESLASSGVTDIEALRGYRVAGCTLSEAARFAADGVAPGAAIVAQRQGIPMTEWVDRLAGIPAEWVPYGSDPEEFGTSRKQDGDPIKDGPLGKGHTLADLKSYADADWKIGRYQWTGQGIWFGGGRRSGDRIYLTPELCRILAANDLTPQDLGRWSGAVTTTSQGSRRESHYVPSLTGAYRWSEELLGDILRLHEAGVKPSHVNDWRYSGARNVDDVLTGVAAGITGPRLAYLRKTYGETRSSYDRTPRLTLKELLDAHETDKQREAAS